MVTFSILLAGFIVGVYFVQLRGPGWSALLAAGRLPELVLVGGAVAALAVVVQVSVLRAWTAASGPRTVRGVLRRALEILGGEDGETSEAYAALPQEVRELVGLFEAQRTREQQIEREKQHLREEIQHLVQALERSGATREPLPTSGGEFAERIARAWNRILAAAGPSPAAMSTAMPTAALPAAAPAAYPAWASGEVAAAPSAPAAYPAWASGEAAAAPSAPAAYPARANGEAAAAAAPTSAVSQRLQELESRLAAMQEEMREVAARGMRAAPVAPAAPAALFLPESAEADLGSELGAPPFAPEVGVASLASAAAGEPEPVAAAGASFSLMPDPMFVEPDVEPTEDPSETGSPTWTDIVPTAVPWAPAAGASFDLLLPEEDAAAEAAPTAAAAPMPTAAPLPAPAPLSAAAPMPVPAPTPQEDLRWSTSEVARPSQPTKASDSGFFEWTGGSTQRGSWKLRDEANEELTRATEAPTDVATQPTIGSTPTPATPTSKPATFAGAPAAPAASPPIGQSFEMYFPHFVGKPVGDLEGRVAVSFEGGSTTTATPRRSPTPGRGAASPVSGPEGSDGPRRPWRPTEYDT